MSEEMRILSRQKTHDSPAIRPDPPMTKADVARQMRTLLRNNPDISRKSAMVCALKTMLCYIADDDVDLAYWDLVQATMLSPRKRSKS